MPSKKHKPLLSPDGTEDVFSNVRPGTVQAHRKKIQADRARGHKVRRRPKDEEADLYSRDDAAPAKKLKPS